ncbi:BspA family leucine-rich repeat surface protein [Vagococcus zengguangii]|uniref:BspA family leucine-rich repeat surface protein n=1 Tax=Vagococcus zengguangii TaxID=2571750 RepID=A0A4D7CSI7_9ENTE|nr:BspA family leucine-rich repeat surface protein [Vagococcus zengguangii]QCI87028.1 BspA family leucine-rich repeat surface protein [Vagococcus zengguangii]
MKKKVLRNAVYFSVIGSFIASDLSGITAIAAEETSTEDTTTEATETIKSEVLPDVTLSESIENETDTNSIEQSNLPKVENDEFDEDSVAPSQLNKQTTSNVLATSEEIVASGIDGTVPWTIYKDGRLVMGPGEMENVEGNYTKEWRHYNYSNIVTSIEFTGELLLPENCSSLFKDFSELTEMKGLHYLNAENVTDVYGMFYELPKLFELDLSNFNASKLKTMSNMFRNLDSLTSLNLSGWKNESLESMYDAFRFMDNLKEINFTDFNTSNVTDMTTVFWDLPSLETLDLSSFDTSKVTSMNEMFTLLNSLKSLNVSNFDTSNLTSMDRMFNDLRNLTSLDLSSFDTSNVTDMSQMFSHMYNLKDLNLSSFDTSNVTNMDEMFYYTNELSSLELSHFDTSKVTSMRYMFGNMEKLTDLDVSNFDTSSVEDMSGMFSITPSLKKLNLSSFDTRNVKEMEGALYSSGFEELTVGNNMKFVSDHDILPEKDNAGKPFSWYGKNTGKKFNTTAEFVEYGKGGLAADTYIRTTEAKPETKPEGDYISFGKYVTVNNDKGYNTWQNFSWKQKHENSKVANNTYLAKGQYKHANGSTYYSLYDSKGTWMGYINAKGTKLADGAQGVYQSFGKYVTIGKNAGYNTWQNFAWKEKHANSKVANKTYLAKGLYNHANGSTYYSLYDSKDTWMGYINAKIAKASANQQGDYINYGKYVTVNNNAGYNTWQNFSWKEKHANSKVANKTYLAKGMYKHSNGSTYYSLYDAKGTWMGYINAKGTQEAGNNKQGVYQNFGKYVTISKNDGYNTWQNFSWKEKQANSAVFDRTFLAKGLYNHANGSTYYSLYDTNGTWYGYINANAAKVAPGVEGLPIIFQDGLKSFKEFNNSYPIWTDLSFKEKVTGWRDADFCVTSVYHHANGSIYYQIGQFSGVEEGIVTVGYINSKATPLIATPRPDYLQVTTDKVFAEKSVWPWSYLKSAYYWDGKEWIVDFAGNWFGEEEISNEQLQKLLAPHLKKPTSPGKEVGEYGESKEIYVWGYHN